MLLPLLYLVAVGAVLYFIAALLGWLFEQVSRALGRSDRVCPSIGDHLIPPSAGATSLHTDLALARPACQDPGA